MTTYRYVCDLDGPLELALPFGSAPPGVVCPHCGGGARRLFTAPLLRLGDASARTLLDRAERSRSQPDVVSAPPAAGRRTAAPALSPLHARLPRP